MDNYIWYLMEEAVAKQAGWRKQTELDALAVQVKEASHGYSTTSWRYHLGQKLIRLGEWLSRTQRGPAITKPN